MITDFQEYFLQLFQRESSNIIIGLRATNEPLFMLPEHIPTISESHDDSPDDTAGLRSRKKVERNISAPLPGMLQVWCCVLSPLQSGMPFLIKFKDSVILYIWGHRYTFTESWQQQSSLPTAFFMFSCSWPF